MLEPTKKPLTDRMVIQGPSDRRGQVEKALRRLGFSIVAQNDDEPSIPWRDALNIHPDGEPGVCLRGARTREGLTQAELSRLAAIPQRHISEMENNKRPIGKETAKRLAGVLHVDYRVLL